MNGPNDNTAAKGLRGWWASPPRPGLQRLIVPYEYRHLRAFGVTRIFGAVPRPPRASCACRTASTDGQPSSWLLRR
jgi:hypothetical protein